METEIIATEGKTKLTITPDRITLKINKRVSPYDINFYSKFVYLVSTRVKVTASFRGKVSFRADGITVRLFGNNKENTFSIYFDGENILIGKMAV